VPEFSGPIGIPDFTAFVGDIDRVRRRHALPVDPVLNEIDTGVLSVRECPTTSERRSTRKRPSDGRLVRLRIGCRVLCGADP